ncbi:hypothetical protein Salat_1406500 [Sesamum alatum]|uniref:CCHC-type domain-containing protein n=1 Tax=Sesamum alatum TaxID=300844 RepID=A0AAE2CLJ9_9LAMI|nr:hypothetical protein Salat_1406500 [Sesamum alatum]
MDGGPWSFEKNLLVLRPVEDDDNPTSIDLNWTDIFIHVHDLPLGRCTKEIAELIGNQLSIFREVDFDHGGQSWGSAFRICVGLNVLNMRVLKLRTTLGPESAITFTYERLPNFCYWCGHLGHTMKSCEYQLEPSFDEKQDPLPFGLWLRASPLIVLRSRGHPQGNSRPLFSATPLNLAASQSENRRGPTVFSYFSAMHTFPTHTSRGITPPTYHSAPSLHPTNIPIQPHLSISTHTQHHHLPPPIYSTTTPTTTIIPHSLSAPNNVTSHTLPRYTLVLHWYVS